MALLLGRHYEFPQCGIIKEKKYISLEIGGEGGGNMRTKTMQLPKIFVQLSD
jgi:hypothetical protein